MVNSIIIKRLIDLSSKYLRTIFITVKSTEYHEASSYLLQKDFIRCRLNFGLKSFFHNWNNLVHKIFYDSVKLGILLCLTMTSKFLRATLAAFVSIYSFGSAAFHFPQNNCTRRTVQTTELSV